MKIFFLAVFVILLIYPAVMADGLEWSIYIDPAHKWDDGGTPKLFVNTPMVIEIQVRNYLGYSIMGGGLPLKIYGQNGLNAIIWNDAGQTTYGPSFESSIAIPGACGSWQNFLYTFSWDGSLPDTFCHSYFDYESCFPITTNPTTIYEMHLTIPTFLEENNFGFNGAEICIDSAGNDFADYNWLFPCISHFVDPVCWDVMPTSCGLAYFVSGPDTLIYTPGQPFNATFEFAIEEKGCDQIHIVLSDHGTATITENHKEPNIVIQWTFDPVIPFCEWINGENKVTITPCGDWGCGYSHDLVIIFPSEPPVMENGCGVNYFVEPEIEHVFPLIATDPEDVGILNWYVVSANPEPDGEYSITKEGEFSFTSALTDVGKSFEFTIKAKDCGGIVSQCSMTAKVVDNPICGDLNHGGQVDIIDIIFFINASYKDGPPPSSAWVADVNGDGFVNILDIIYLIDYKFKGGPLPSCL